MIKPGFCLHVRENKAADQLCGNTQDRRKSRTPQAIYELSGNLSSVALGKSGGKIIDSYYCTKV